MTNSFQHVRASCQKTMGLLQTIPLLHADKSVFLQEQDMNYALQTVYFIALNCCLRLCFYCVQLGEIIATENDTLFLGVVSVCVSAILIGFHY